VGTLTPLWFSEFEDNQSGIQGSPQFVVTVYEKSLKRTKAVIKVRKLFLYTVKTNCVRTLITALIWLSSNSSHIQSQ
jgi:hypothetical protein